MNAYMMYEIGDIFENNNNSKYVIIGLNKEQDKALLTTMDKPVCYIVAKGLREHDWAYGHYFMHNLGAALEYFAQDDSKAEDRNREKYLFELIYNCKHITDRYKEQDCKYYIVAYTEDEAIDALFDMYKNTEWNISICDIYTCAWKDLTTK